MITLSADQLQALLYRAKTDAIVKYRAEYCWMDSTPWEDHARFYSGLELDATHLANNTLCTPIDLDRIASVI